MASRTLHSVPPALQQATADPHLCPRLWTLTGKSGSVSCGITAPFFWALVHTRFCLCPPRVCFPVLCKFWHFYGGVNNDLLQEGLCHTQICCTQSPYHGSRPLLTSTSTRDAHSRAGLAQSLWSLLVCTRFCLSLPSVSGGYGV